MRLQQVAAMSRTVFSPDDQMRLHDRNDILDERRRWPTKASFSSSFATVRGKFRPALSREPEILTRTRQWREIRKRRRAG
jgi:hypothetical protein